MDWSGIIGNVGGALVGGLFGQSSASQQYERQKELMALQHQYQVDDYKHRYQWSIEDMKLAGLNPILAATNGIGGSINGVSAGTASMAPVPDFAAAMSSAFQTSSQKDIAKMVNEIQKGELELKKLDINSALEKRNNDIKLDNARFDLEKWTAEQNMHLKEVFQDAQIKNMADRLAAEVEHWKAQDMNGAAMASAAMASASASGLMARVQAELGVSRQEMMEAQKAFLAIQSDNAEEALKWQRWLNDHPVTRGAVGFLGSLFDVVGIGAKLKGGVGAFSSEFSSNSGLSDTDYESWIR